MTASRSISAIVLVASLAIVSCGGGGTPAALTSPSVAPTASPTWTPTRDIELVVQAAAGGGSDLFARKIAALLTSEKAVTRPINVVNKPGGSGAVAYAYVQQKKADPHTLATITLSYLTTPLEQSTGFTYKDFSNLVTLAVDDFVAVVKAEASYQSLGDLVKAAKAKPKDVKVGGTQLGSSDSIIPALVEQAAGVQFNYITFKSGGEVNAALLGGTVDFAIANPGEVLSLIQGKKLRAVAAFSPSRLAGYDIPTAKEQGIDVVWEQFRGIIAPGGLDAAQQAYWQNSLTQITKSAEWTAYLKENTLRPLLLTGPAAQQYLDTQNANLKQVLTKLGVIK